jgi:hypothetical protein
MERRLGGWPRATAIGVAAAYVTYLLAGNALLNSAYGRALANRMPEKFVASWGSAWTLFPGQVRASDLRLAGHVRHTVWSVQADSVRGRVALLPLLAREVRVPALVATGVSGGANRIDVERVPPSPRPGGWTFRFDDVLAETVRYAYFNSLVLEGQGHARGGFVKVTRGGPMEVLPSTLGFQDGVIFRDGMRLAWDSRIESLLAIARHRREEAPGIRKLEKTNLDVAIEATTAGLRLEHDAQRRPTLSLSSGPGRLTGRIGWRQGSLAPGGALSLAFPASGNLDGKDESTEAAIELNVTDAEIHIKGGVAPISDGSLSAAADLAIRGTDVPLQEIDSLTKRTSGQFFGRWHFDSLAWLADLLPGPKIVAFDGAGTTLIDLKFHDGQLDAGSFVEVPKVQATASALGNRFDGNAHARITFQAARPGELRPQLVAEMEDFRIAPADAPDQPYVRGEGLRIEATARGDRSTLDDRVRARIWFKDARVPDMRAYNRYLPNSSLQILGGEGRVSGDLQFDRKGNVGHGSFLVDGRRVQLAVADLVMQGDVVVDTRLQRTDLAAHQFNADGSEVSLQDVRITRGEDLLGSDWWGHVGLVEARLDWDKPMTIDGKVKVRLKDAGALLALYAQRKHLPEWVGKVIDAGEVQAEGRIRVRQGTLLLDPLDARNERFDVRARLRLHEKQASGDLYARWGALGMGVELDNGKRQVHLADARKWYDGRPALDER